VDRQVRPAADGSDRQFDYDPAEGGEGGIAVAPQPRRGEQAPPGVSHVCTDTVRLQGRGFRALIIGRGDPAPQIVLSSVSCGGAQFTAPKTRA